MATIRKDISPIDLQIELKRKNLKQRELKKRLKVSDGAISRAIQNDPALKSLRLKIIRHLSSIQNIENAK